MGRRQDARVKDPRSPAPHESEVEQQTRIQVTDALALTCHERHRSTFHLAAFGTVALGIAPRRDRQGRLDAPKQRGTVERFNGRTQAGMMRFVELVRACL